MIDLKNLVPVIGLEIHVEVNTASKMFCQCRANYFGSEPNINVCPVCLGYPGALPVPNIKAIEKTIRLALGFNCRVRRSFKFDRKHYFYPDLPKGYQISQYDTPIGENGFLEVDFESKEKVVYKKFRIRRVHLEEDTGKLLHEGGQTLIDYNRSGVPLIEIVTEPDFHEVEEVVRFVEEVQRLVRWLDISDADMEKGSMRLEPNVSLGEKLLSGEIKLLDYKVELKNINSFRFARKAVEYEIERQRKIFEKGEVPKQETRGYDETRGITFSQRKKEAEQDYRYFPEPDIPRVELKEEFVEKIKRELPVLPIKERRELIEKYSLRLSDALVLTREKRLLDFYKQLLKELENEKIEKLPQRLANAIVNKKVKIEDWDTEKFKERFLQLFGKVEEDLVLVEKVAREVISSFPKAVQDFKKGKENALMFLVGQAMRQIRGKAKPNTVKGKILEMLRS